MKVFAEVIHYHGADCGVAQRRVLGTFGLLHVLFDLESDADSYYAALPRYQREKAARLTRAWSPSILAEMQDNGHVLLNPSMKS